MGSNVGSNTKVNSKKDKSKDLGLFTIQMDNDFQDVSGVEA